jgi:hypothetical protein
MECPRILPYMLLNSLGDAESRGLAKRSPVLGHPVSFMTRCQTLVQKKDAKHLHSCRATAGERFLLGTGLDSCTGLANNSSFRAEAKLKKKDVERPGASFLRAFPS